MKRNAVWALSNLCRGKNPPPDFAKVSPALPILAHLLFFNDTDVLADTCWALSYLSDGPNEKVQAVIGKFPFTIWRKKNCEVRILIIFS